MDGRKLYIDKQEAGPYRDHLVSRATTVFKAKLVNPESGEKTGWDWCYKSSWVQHGRRHEGEYLKQVQGLPHVVELLAYGVVEVEEKKEEDGVDTTANGRGISSGDSMIMIEKFFEKVKKEGRNLFIHTSTKTQTKTQTKTATSDRMNLLLDPRRPIL